MTVGQIGLGASQRVRQTSAWNYRSPVLGSLTGGAGKDIPVPVYDSEVGRAASAHPSSPNGRQGFLRRLGLAVQGSFGVPRVTGWRYAGPSLLGVNQFSSLAQIIFGKHLVNRHVHEVRVSNVLVAVSEGQVQGLAHGVDVLGRVMTHGRQIEAFENLQRLRECGALSPWPSAVHLVATVIYRHRWEHLDMVGSQVFFREQATRLLVEGGYLAAKLAGVDIIPGCLERRLPAIDFM